MLQATDLDMGTVPAWFGGLSLILAFVVFARDRNSAERKDVDLIGTWWETEYERRAPNDKTGRVEKGSVRLTIKNAGNLPVDIFQLAIETSTKWAVRDLDQWEREPDGSYSEGPGVWTVKPGKQTQKHFLGPLRPPPQDRVDHSFEVNVAHMAPEHADQLHLFEGIRCKILWMLIVDNAGRRWEVRPGVGRRARRVRWFSRRREYQPPEFWTAASRIRQWAWNLRVRWGRRRSAS
jgi:hypothetical protein